MALGARDPLLSIFAQQKATKDQQNQQGLQNLLRLLTQSGQQLQQNKSAQEERDFRTEQARARVQADKGAAGQRTQDAVSLAGLRANIAGAARKVQNEIVERRRAEDLAREAEGRKRIDPFFFPGSDAPQGPPNITPEGDTRAPFGGTEQLKIRELQRRTAERKAGLDFDRSENLLNRQSRERLATGRAAPKPQGPLTIDQHGSILSRIAQLRNAGDERGAQALEAKLKVRLGGGKTASDFHGRGAGPGAVVPDRGSTPVVAPEPAVVRSGVPASPPPPRVAAPVPVGPGPLDTLPPLLAPSAKPGEVNIRTRLPREEPALSGVVPPVATQGQLNTFNRILARRPRVLDPITTADGELDFAALQGPDQRFALHALGGVEAAKPGATKASVLALLLRTRNDEAIMEQLAPEAVKKFRAKPGVGIRGGSLRPAQGIVAVKGSRATTGGRGWQFLGPDKVPLTEGQIQALESAAGGTLTGNPDSEAASFGKSPDTRQAVFEIDPKTALKQFGPYSDEALKSYVDTVLAPRHRLQ